MTKRKLLSGKSWRGVPLGAFLVFPRRHHCSIFATHWAMTLFSNVRYTSTLTVVTGAPFLTLAVQNTFNPFLPIVLNTGCYSCVLLRGTEFEGNRSSPPYAICLNWITFLQFVGFDSNYSFTDVTVKSNRTGNIPRRLRGIV